MPDRAPADFPFYDGHPRRLSLRRWSVAFAMCALGFAALEVSPVFGRGPVQTFTAMSLFGLCALAGLGLAAGRDWAAAFRRPTLRDVAAGVLGALLTMVASGIVAALIYGAAHGAVAANPAMAKVAESGAVERVTFLAGSLLQLVGEEIVTLVPFLAILTLASGPLALKRPIAIGAAWLGSALIFAAIHLPTYDWRVVQTLAVIGVARLALTTPYLVTKNLWSSVIAHVANDWILILVVIGLR